MLTVTPATGFDRTFDRIKNTKAALAKLAKQPRQQSSRYSEQRNMFLVKSRMRQRRVSMAAEAASHF
jgi:hypothetical protein